MRSRRASMKSSNVASSWMYSACAGMVSGLVGVQHPLDVVHQHGARLGEDAALLDGEVLVHDGVQVLGDAVAHGFAVLLGIAVVPRYTP